MNTPTTKQPLSEQPPEKPPGDMAPAASPAETGPKTAPAASPAQAGHKTAYWYRLAFAGCCVLLLFATLPLLWFASASIGQWLMHALPLALLLPGLARRRRRSLQWLGFVLLFILVLGVLQCFVPQPRYQVLGVLNVAGSLAMFLIVIVATRLDVRHSQGAVP